MKRLIIWLSLAMTGFPLYAADPLVIFSGRSDKFVKPVIEAFTRDSGIEVVLHSAKSTELLNKLHALQRQLGAKMPQPIDPQ